MDCRRRSLAHPDAGFTLVEVIVAMVLFTTVITATGILVARSLSGTGRATRAVSATMLANAALENARNVVAQAGADGTTALLQGRTPAVVDAVSVADLQLADTEIAYGDAAAAPLVPVVTTTPVDGIPYTVRTVIGTCTRDAAGGACDLAGGHTDPVTLHRVVAAVTWPGCTTRECPTTATTLVDTARDPKFNALQDVLPVAVAKCFATGAGTALTFDPTYQSYTVRDTGDLGSTPVQVVAAPGQGQLQQNTGTVLWTYTPASGNYTTQFTYRLVDRYTRYSDPAVVTLRVGQGPC